jgi:hypothetical protein
MATSSDIAEDSDKDEFLKHVRTAARDGRMYLTFKAESAVTVIAELFRMSTTEVCIFLDDLPYEIAFHPEVLAEARRFLLRRPDNAIRIMVRSTSFARDSRYELLETLRDFRRKVPRPLVFITRVKENRSPAEQPFNFVWSYSSGSYWMGKGPWQGRKHEGTYQFGRNDFSANTLLPIIDRDGQGFRRILQ